MNTDPMPDKGQATKTTQDELQAEVDRLRAALREAEEQIADLQRQRDKYYEFTKAWIAQNCKESDWDGFDPAEYTLEFDEKFLAQLEAEFKR